MQIGNLKLENNTILAPLAGITNLPFRLLAKEAGCGLVCSEMISAHGLVYKSRKTEKMMDSAPEEKPVNVPDANLRAAIEAAENITENITITEAEVEEEDGRTVYDLEGIEDRIEYEIEVTVDSKVLEVEQEDENNNDAEDDN